MEKTKLVIDDIYLIDAELERGIVAGEPLLSQKLPWPVKFKLNLLAKSVKAIVEPANETKKELYVKYGKPDEKGNYVVKEPKEGDGPEVAENYNTFIKEFKSFSETEVELEHHEFKLEMFEKLETQEVYIGFMKLCKI